MMTELPDGSYQLSGAGKTYVISGMDADQYVVNRTLKILEGDWP